MFQLFNELPGWEASRNITCFAKLLQIDGLGSFEEAFITRNCLYVWVFSEVGTLGSG